MGFDHRPGARCDREIIARWAAKAWCGASSLCWDPDREEAVDRAYRIWPNTALAGQLAQDLRTVGHMEQAIEMIDRSDIGKAPPCGPDSAPIIESIEKAAAMGIDHIYLHQIGDPRTDSSSSGGTRYVPRSRALMEPPRSWDGASCAAGRSSDQ